MATMNSTPLESLIRDASPSIRGAKEVPEYNDSILPLIFTKRLRNLFDDELNRIADCEFTERAIGNDYPHVRTGGRP